MTLSRHYRSRWSGERARGFAERMENDLMGLKPTVATLCYGMRAVVGSPGVLDS